MVVEYQKSLMGFLICQLSSILSIFLNQEFSFCTQMEPSFDFWLLLKIHWLQNTKPPRMSSKKEKLCGFFGGWRRVSGAVSSSCDSVHLSVLLFCTCIVQVGNTLSVCYTARRGLYQMMAVEAHQTGLHRLRVSSRAWAVPSSLWYKAASAQRSFACRSGESWWVSKPSEWLFHHSQFKLMIFRKNQIYHVKI